MIEVIRRRVWPAPLTQEQTDFQQLLDDQGITHLARYPDGNVAMNYRTRGERQSLKLQFARSPLITDQPIVRVYHAYHPGLWSQEISRETHFELQNNPAGLVDINYVFSGENKLYESMGSARLSLYAIRQFLRLDVTCRQTFKKRVEVSALSIKKPDPASLSQFNGISPQDIYDYIRSVVQTKIPSIDDLESS